MAAPTFTVPNVYHLHGGGIHVTYSTTSISGQPLFSYHDTHGSHNFMGDQITVEKTSIGNLVTVVLRLTPDAGSTSFSVLIPIVNLTGPTHPSPVQTEGITTIHRFSINPALLHGQIELYHVTPLHGTANQVPF
ncbi:hypothetical protein [Limnoglobus roseus]|uniref:Uncharacterized protein n=1 Tax=Limnoglobus roseus TaxID=2598579 RepID=A0A5C1ABR7_9BACT|nr:hypothetical protein [Limnoglobus roseus]QEL14594.1 hypothetical protein PX52LOC_01484 [Limnoglobus roseus]